VLIADGEAGVSVSSTDHGGGKLRNLGTPMHPKALHHDAGMIPHG
jgi:hypothetical protein